MNYKTRCNLEKYICLIGLILFTIGSVFIIFSLTKLNNINLHINNTNTNHITILAGWGLLLIGLSIFIIISSMVYIIRYKPISIKEPLLNIP